MLGGFFLTIISKEPPINLEDNLSDLDKLYIKWINFVYQALSKSRNDSSELIYTRDIVSDESLFNRNIKEIINLLCNINSAEYVKDNNQLLEYVETIRSIDQSIIFSNTSSLKSLLISALQNEFIMYYNLAEIITEIEVEGDYKLTTDDYIMLVINFVRYLSLQHLGVFSLFRNEVYSRNEMGSIDFTNGMNPKKFKIIKEGDIYKLVLSLYKDIFYTSNRPQKGCPIHRTSGAGDSRNVYQYDADRFRPLIEFIVKLKQIT